MRISYFVVISVIGAGNQRKPPTHPQVTDKLYQIILYGIHLTGVVPCVE
jgi:hypothetical protein